jgi:hypothetical protein
VSGIKTRNRVVDERRLVCHAVAVAGNKGLPESTAMTPKGGSARGDRD